MEMAQVAVAKPPLPASVSPAQVDLSDNGVGPALHVERTTRQGARGARLGGSPGPVVLCGDQSVFCAASALALALALPFGAGAAGGLS